MKAHGRMLSGERCRDLYPRPFDVSPLSRPFCQTRLEAENLTDCGRHVVRYRSKSLLCRVPKARVRTACDEPSGMSPAFK
jgi:hypothetical protein